jgi:hypothetical protein
MGGGGIWEDMCYERRRAEACVVRAWVRGKDRQEGVGPGRYRVVSVLEISVPHSGPRDV